MIAESVRITRGFTRQTLELGQDLADRWAIHPLMVAVTREIVKGVTDPVGEARAIWSWIRSNVAYRHDPVGAEWVQDPFETAFKTKAGDCDDMATLAAAMLQSIGHPSRVAAVRWVGRDDFSHAVATDDRIGAVVDPVSPVFEWPPAGREVLSMMYAG